MMIAGAIVIGYMDDTPARGSRDIFGHPRLQGYFFCSKINFDIRFNGLVPFEILGQLAIVILLITDNNFEVCKLGYIVCDF